MTIPTADAVCSAEPARLLLAAVAEKGADARSLAREARLPPWALAPGDAMIPFRTLARLWELAEHATGNPGMPLAVATNERVGKVGLYGYLFATAATLRDALQAAMDYLHLVTTNSRMLIETETGQFTTYSWRRADDGGRGAELALQFSLGALCAQVRAGASRPAAPVHVGLAQPAPRSHHDFAEALGASRIDFAAPITTVTFRARDLDQLMPGSDPGLARILRRYAGSFTPPSPVTWPQHFAQVLSEAIDHGSPSLQTVARQLGVSTRTLQRRLAERDTSWRAELDAARQRRAERASQSGQPAMSRLARDLGYADPRSARRAFQRWESPVAESRLYRADQVTCCPRRG